jgi:hypothetical protein
LRFRTSTLQSLLRGLTGHSDRSQPASIYQSFEISYRSLRLKNHSLQYQHSSGKAFSFSQDFAISYADGGGHSRGQSHVFVGIHARLAIGLVPSYRHDYALTKEHYSICQSKQSNESKDKAKNTLSNNERFQVIRCLSLDPERYNAF